MENGVSCIDRLNEGIGTVDGRTVFVDDLVDLLSDCDNDHKVDMDKMEGDSTDQPHFNGSIMDAPVTARFSPTSLPKHLTTSALASHLYRGRPGNSSTRDVSRRSSITSDDLDSASASDPGCAVLVSPEELSELNNRMQNLQNQLKHQEEMDERYVRMKRENATLQEEVNSLEEQLMVKEEKWRNELNEIERKYKDLLSNAERQKLLEVDSLTAKCLSAEQEHEQCNVEREKLYNEIDQMKRECEQLEESIANLQRELDENKNAKKDTEQRLWKEKEEVEKKLRNVLEAREELRREIDLLKNEKGHIGVTASELEREIRRLKDDQRRLKEANDELHAELFNVSLEQGRKVLEDNGPSLAEEMKRMTKDEVLDALREQEVVNKKLRVYVDGILLRIMEMYPAILEIKPDEQESDTI